MESGRKFRFFAGAGKRYLVTIVLAACVLWLALFGESSWLRRGKLDYASSLDVAAAVVNGRELTLRDLAFYVACEEAWVEAQALAYNPEDTGAYWKVHKDGTFVRTAARNAVIQMAVHDELFAHMAEADGVTLSAEEKAALLSAQEDFWQDLVEDGCAEGLGVLREDIYAAMERAALAGKYQEIYEQLQGASEGAYAFDAPAYEEFLEKEDCEIDREVLRRLDIGNVTIRR